MIDLSTVPGFVCTHPICSLRFESKSWTLVVRHLRAVDLLLVRFVYLFELIQVDSSSLFTRV